jgi:hypothetical protein
MCFYYRETYTSILFVRSVLHSLSLDKPHILKQNSARPKHSSCVHIYLMKGIEFRRLKIWMDEERNKFSFQDLFFVFKPWSP